MLATEGEGYHRSKLFSVDRQFLPSSDCFVESKKYTGTSFSPLFVRFVLS